MRNPIFVAIDRPDAAGARALACDLAGDVGGIKLGLEFFVANGPDGVRRTMQGLALPLFLDLKLHDIPNTVAGALSACAGLAPGFVTVHASGGAEMLRAAVAAAREAPTPPRLLGVTVLTSLGDDDLAAVGQAPPAGDQVRRLAALALDCGLDGLVCSPREVAGLRAEFGPDPVLMVPGIRPAGAAGDDQKRVLTPRAALDAGASHLVVGRPITAADDPAAAARAIAAALQAG